MIFVTTGTFGFPELIKAVDILVKRKVIDADEIIAQIGNSQYFPKFFNKFFRTEKDISGYMREATLVISHGGTGTILELLELGKVCIAVPNTLLADNHQFDFLKYLGSMHYILFCDEPTPSKIHACIERSRNFVPSRTSIFPETFINELKKDIFGQEV